eukprot:3441136-Pleurochrysis_carterae.AAC.3
MRTNVQLKSTPGPTALRARVGTLRRANAGIRTSLLRSCKIAHANRSSSKIGFATVVADKEWSSSRDFLGISQQGGTVAMLF